MQTLETFHLAWRMRWVVLATVLIPAVAAFAFSSTRPDSYATSIAFTVNRINKQTTTEYQFDGYYALQASDLFSDTVLSWFLTPSVIVQIYERANVDPKVEDLTKLTARFSIKKYSSQNLVLRFSTPTSEEAEALSQSIIGTVEERSAELNQTADRKALFEVIGEKPVTAKQGKQQLLATIVGLFFGAFAAVATIGALAAVRTRRDGSSTT